jgi:HK97 family phage major capsid protein
MPELFTRAATVDPGAIDPASLTVPVIISTETPYDRGSYMEILGHRPDEIDLSRAPLPLIEQHDSGQLNIGVVENLHIDNGKLRGLARFSRTIPRSMEVYGAIADGIIRNVSVGYCHLDDGVQDSSDRRALRFRWQPFEASAVSVPADPNAGFYRSEVNAPAVHTPSKSQERKHTMSQVDLRQHTEYSLSRAIAAAASGDWSQAGFEREVSQELQRGRHNAKGLLVPMSALIPSTRVMNTTDQAAMIPTDHFGFIDILRPHSRVVEAGATVLPGLVGNVEIPRQTASLTAEWLSEDAALSGGDLSMDAVTLTPKVVGSMTSWSRKMMQQSVPGIEDLARNDLAAVIGRAVDLAALHGLGASNQPAGIYAAGGTNAVAMGGVPTFGKLVDMVAEVAKDNALEGRLGFMTTPGMAGKLAQTLMASSAGSNMIWEGSLAQGRLAGFNAYATNQVRSDMGAGSEHGLIFGNWAELIIGQWGALDVLVDPYTNADRGRVRITSFMTVDIGIRHGASFTKATGASV